jgi:putative flippase GtrA
MTAGRAPLTPIIGQFLRFAAVGAGATGVHYVVSYLMLETGRIGPAAATTIGYACGALVSYVLNRVFTFDRRIAFAMGLAKYAAVIGAGLAINTGIVAGLVAGGVSYWPAQIVATGLVLFWNFFASRKLVFGAAPGA